MLYIYDLPHIIFDGPILQSKRLVLLNSIKSINIPFKLSSILNTNFEVALQIIIAFILEADFII